MKAEFALEDVPAMGERGEKEVSKVTAFRDPKPTRSRLWVWEVGAVAAALVVMAYYSPLTDRDAARSSARVSSSGDMGETRIC